MSTQSFVLTPRGEFSLAHAIRFLRGFAPLTPGDEHGDETLRLALHLERSWAAVGIAARQDEAGAVTAIVIGEADREEARDQLARILSLDVDAWSFEKGVAGDDVAAGLVRELRGLRPVCFGSPYEAATWAVLSQRIQMQRAARIRRRVCEELGPTIDVDGVAMPAFPGPARLLRAPSIQGLPQVKVDRLHALAEAALDGRLDAARLRAAGPEEALAELQRLPGIGPFGAELVLIRGAGEPDHFSRTERRLHAAMAEAYGVDAADVDALATIAARWIPFRSWIGFLFRTRASGARPGI
jgi:3-methyladenine DNA glycosylase/8-oxoguanine DNA glycosylase